MSSQDRAKCIREDQPYESRFPLFKFRIDCWAYKTATSRRFKAYKIVYAESYREAVEKADTFPPLIIGVRCVAQVVKIS